MPTKKYDFKLVLGDWSNDGHGEYSEYTITCSHKIDTIRSAYFNAKKMLDSKISPENIRFSLPDIIDVIKAIQKSGFKRRMYVDLQFSEFSSLNLDTRKSLQEWLLEYTLWFIRQGNKNIRISVKNENQIPYFHFFGFDKQKRHIRCIGYDLYSPY